jgi:hypothetical protein
MSAWTKGVVLRALTLYSEQLLKGRTILLGVCHMLMRHARQICVQRKALADRPRIGIEASALLQTYRLFSNLRSVVLEQYSHVSGVSDSPIPLPRLDMKRAFASRLCPDLIMQPHPVSLVKPSACPNCVRSRTVNVRALPALGSCDLGIEGKPDLYVIHTRDSKSSKNSEGQPASSPCSSLAASATACLSTMTGGSFTRLSSSHTEEVGSDTCVAELAIKEGEELAEEMTGACWLSYLRPRHQMGAPDRSSFRGMGS